MREPVCPLEQLIFVQFSDPGPAHFGHRREPSRGPALAPILPRKEPHSLKLQPCTFDRPCGKAESAPDRAGAECATGLRRAEAVEFAIDELLRWRQELSLLRRPGDSLHNSRPNPRRPHDASPRARGVERAVQAGWPGSRRTRARWARRLDSACGILPIPCHVLCDRRLCRAAFAFRGGGGTSRDGPCPAQRLTAYEARRREALHARSEGQDQHFVRRHPHTHEANPARWLFGGNGVHGVQSTIVRLVVWKSRKSAKSWTSSRPWTAKPCTGGWFGSSQSVPGEMGWSSETSGGS